MKLLLDGQSVVSAAGFAAPPDAPGVFETLPWRDGALLLGDDHHRRFNSGCRHFGITPPWLASDLPPIVAALARENGVTHGVVRYCAWRENDRPRNVVEVTAPRPHQRKPAFEVTAAPLTARPSLAESAFKHLQRRAWLQALHAARESGYDEVILHDEHRQVIEGAVSNVFAVLDNQLVTPSLPLGPLPGIMRARVIAQAAELGRPVREGSLSLDDLQRASEVWLTNSLIGIRPVTRIGPHRLTPQRPFLDELRRHAVRSLGWDPLLLPP